VSGGFLLMIVSPERRENFGEAPQVRRCVNLEIDFGGSIINT
jgi:hypothetical protein